MSSWRSLRRRLIARSGVMTRLVQGTRVIIGSAKISKGEKPEGWILAEKRIAEMAPRIAALRAEKQENLTALKDARLTALRAEKASRVAQTVRQTAVQNARKAVAEAKAALAQVRPSARAQRPIGLYYDELSRGINPFSLYQTAGVADVTDSAEHIAGLFNTYGIVKVKRVYSQERSQLLNQHCISFSGLQPEDYVDVFNKQKKWGTGGSPVLKDSRFWPYVADPKIAEVVQLLLGKGCFEFGSAVAAHYSARGLHRDYRHLVEDETSDYSFRNPKKRIVRILHYCGVSGGALGYIPNSHDESRFQDLSRKVGITQPTEWFNRHRDVLTQARLKRDFVEADELERHICWANADPGDIIISNSAMLHCGEYLTGPRYFFVSTYAQNDPDNLRTAIAQTMQFKATKYHEHLLEHGFQGSADVLKGVAEAEKAGLLVEEPKA